MPHSHPESLMMSHGYKPASASGAIKAPLYQTSTFSFQSAEDGKAFFEYLRGERDELPESASGYLYSRLSNPNLAIVEKRLCLWDKADDCALFESGMAAINTAMLSHLKAGDVLLYHVPIYNGAYAFINNVLSRFGIELLTFSPGDTRSEILERAHNSGKADKLAMIYAETPVNPTNELVDIAMCRDIADELSTKSKQVKLAVDNTYMGPLWQSPLEQGADFVIYSASKYIGGHSDVIAGAVLGAEKPMQTIRQFRNDLGTMASPHTAWLLMRSLETLKLRMEKQTENAQKLATYLDDHPKIDRVYYPGLLKKGDRDYPIFNKQCKGPGAMIAFDMAGGEKAAFAFLNRLKLIKISVSLGGTESLAQHMTSMSHSGMDKEWLAQMGITDKLIRFSVGVENVEDLLADLENGLEN